MFLHFPAIHIVHVLCAFVFPKNKYSYLTTIIVRKYFPPTVGGFQMYAFGKYTYQKLGMINEEETDNRENYKELKMGFKNLMKMKLT